MTRLIVGQFDTQVTLEYGYMYRFHPSILFINRQIYHEASNIFYMENLFVRVNTVTPGPLFSQMHSNLSETMAMCCPFVQIARRPWPALRHIMEICLIPDSLSSGQQRNRHLIIACELRRSSYVLQISVIFFINERSTRRRSDGAHATAPRALGYYW